MIKEINYTISINIIGAILSICLMVLALITQHLFFIICMLFSLMLTFEIGKDYIEEEKKT